MGFLVKDLDSNFYNLKIKTQNKIKSISTGSFYSESKKKNF
jgi:hypothetical protein